MSKSIFAPIFTLESCFDSIVQGGASVILALLNCSLSNEASVELALQKGGAFLVWLIFLCSWGCDDCVSE